MSSIRISQLNDFDDIKSDDFIPLVDSSSLTTYRITVTDFNSYFAASGSCVSASWASSSVVSISSSWASSSILSISASYANTASTTIGTASYALSAGSSSHAVTSSHANSAFATTGTASFANTATSASYAQTAGIAITSSYFDFSLPGNVPPFATSSLSSSWASASYTASIATTASYAHTASFAVSASYVNPAGNFIKAFATMYSINNTGGNPSDLLPFSGSYNIISASYRGAVNQESLDGVGMGIPVGASYGLPAYPHNNFGIMHCWIVYMRDPLPSKNYTIITSDWGEQTSEWGYSSNIPSSRRTTTAFSISINGGNMNWDNRGDEYNWVSIMVLHP